MSKSKFGWALVIVAALGFMSLVVAGDAAKPVTLEGKVACAKCTLALGAKDCQNVLVVAKEGGEPQQYWLVKNEVTETFGHACEAAKGAVVTGTVQEKDGKMWLTATKMAPGAKA